MKVFLGGTCNGSTWRDKLIPKLRCEFFNPVVENWDQKARAGEIRQRDECDYKLYVITSEASCAFFTIAELVDDSNKIPEKTIMCLLEDGFDEEQLKSLWAVKSLVHVNRAKTCNNLDSVATYLNNRLEQEKWF